MRLRLVHRMTLAFWATLLAVVALVVLALYASVAQGFSRYVRGLEEARLEAPLRRLSALYARDGDFGVISEDPRRLRRLLRREETAEERLPHRGEPWAGEERGGRVAGRDPLELPPRVTLYDSAGARVAGEGTAETDGSRLPIQVDGRTVGWLGLRPISRLESALDVDYLSQVRLRLSMVALGALLLGAVAGSWTARRLARPVEALRAGTQRLAAGEYAARLEVQARDELGRLAEDFNALAEKLEADARSRRQWVADTSHELRTPLTVLRAELEALAEGVRPLTHGALDSLRVERGRLEKLVEDLAELARSDRGEFAPRREPLDVGALLGRSLAAFAGRFEQARLGLTCTSPEEPLRAWGDPDRLQQVFANLLENSLRYTDAGGRLEVQLQRAGGGVEVRFDDTAPGVRDEELARLFERLFRAEPSRSRAHGGAGLGLAICQRWVGAQGGRMTAAHSPLGGVRMEIWLPEAEA